MELTNRTILITGVSTGIGFELARQLIALGNTVVGCARHANRLAEAKAALPQLHTMVCDVATDAERRRLFAEATERFPTLSVVVANAGIQRPIDLLAGEAGLEDATAEIAINVNAPVHMAMLFMPFLMQQPHATFVNVSSGLAFAPRASFPVYCATKAAVHSFSQSLRHQARNTAVQVFELIPPMVVSELAGREVMATRGGMPTAECAAAMVHALQHDMLEHAIGQAEWIRANPAQAMASMNPA